MSEHAVTAGFERERKSDVIKTQLETKVLDEINKRLSTVFTSTPTAQRRSIMDLSFLKCYEHVVGAGLQAPDSDSGYMSNPLEATLEHAEKEATMFINKSPRFISEDALQEKPPSVKKTHNQDVYQEHISYFTALQSGSSSSSEKSTIHPKPALNLVLDDIVPETDEEISPIIKFDKQPVFVHLDDSNGSNKENIAFEKSSQQKMANVKMTPRKSQKRRRRSSSVTPTKKFINTVNPDISPDLFDDAEPLCALNQSVESIACNNTEQYVQKIDSLLMKKINKCLSGVLPPPSFTTTHITVAQMLEKLYSDEHQVFYWNANNMKEKEVISDANCSVNAVRETIMVNCDLESALVRPWPHILRDRCHGLNYNHSKAAEDTEALLMRYGQRYVGAETQSSCTVFESVANTPSKRKANRLRWVNKSPGRRLSHLARRRITFSSANIQAASSSHSRQIMVDAKRFELLSRRVSPRKTKSPRKSPRKALRRTKSVRKTPRKTPLKIMPTPSSSAKKRLAFKVLDHENTAPSTSSDSIVPSTSSAAIRASATKRALFQSPEKNITVTKMSRNSLPSTSNASGSPWKKSTPKRALFMSPSKSMKDNDTNNKDCKRKRLDSEDDRGFLGCKFARSISLQNEHQSGSRLSGGQMENTGRDQGLMRVKSESLLNGTVVELSDHHKKKLQWAVYEALRSVNIRMDHENFRQYASVLARVTRRLLPTVAASNVGTSERMLRITKQHVYSVIKGKTMEEIIRNYENNRLKQQRPSGYIRKEDEIKQDVSIARSNVFQDCANTIQASTEKKNKLNNAVEKKPSIENKVDRVKKIIKF